MRDLPILLDEVRPLRREKAEIESRAEGIISDCLAILQAVGEADVIALMRWQAPAD